MGQITRIASSGAGRLLSYDVLTGAGIYAPPAGADSLYVIVQAPGGGSGAVDAGAYGGGSITGRSAAAITVGEPLSNGLRDTGQVLPLLMSGVSMMECLPRSAVPRSHPGQEVYDGTLVTIIGDPLYAPYRHTAMTSGAAPAVL
jgi:hypothetical protein